jgi:hypothetical protein
MWGHLTKDSKLDDDDYRPTEYPGLLKPISEKAGRLRALRGRRRRVGQAHGLFLEESARRTAGYHRYWL